MADLDQLASLLATAGSSSTGLGSAAEYRTLLQHLRLRLQQVSRTEARKSFHSLADSKDITLVTNHDRLDEAVVMMRGDILAHLLDAAVQTAVHKATHSRPLLARLEGLKPVPAGHEAVQLRADTRHTRQTLDLGEEAPADVTR